MRSLTRFVRVLVIAVGVAPAATAVAQIAIDSADGAPITASKDSTRNPSDSAQAGGGAEPAASSLETALSGIKLSGYAEASYLYSTAALPGGPVVGRSFDRFHDQFTLNVVKLVLDKGFDPGKLTAGFHADLLFGQNATLIQSAGLNLGDDGDIEQLYVTLNVPTANGNGIQFKAGKWVTLMGLEVIEDVVNPNWSEGNQFLFVENFTSTGLEVDYKWNKYFDTELRVFNGWDVVQDNNTRKSFMGRLGITPDDKTVIGLVGYLGPEQANNDDAKRKGVDLVVNRKFGGRVSAWGQFDYGKEDANAALPDPTRDADWWAVGGWLTLDMTPKVGIALRGDYLDDKQGARTSAAPFTAPFPGNLRNKLSSGTATLNIRAWENTLLRPEIRYDHSNVSGAFGDSNDQVTLGLSAAYIY
jgi:putative OmpL-like beta-barrel porin-2